jgi:hypothetical protein
MEASQNAKTKIQFNRGRPHLEIPKDTVPNINLNPSDSKSPDESGKKKPAPRVSSHKKHKTK